MKLLTHKYAKHVHLGQRSTIKCRQMVNIKYRPESQNVRK